MKLFGLIILTYFSVLVYGEEKIDESLLLFRERCSACHLDSGHGLKALNVASIAGLPRWYVTQQVRHFRDGKRGAHPEDKHGKLMRDLAQNLDDRSLAFLGKYVQSLEPLKERKTIAVGDVARGKKLYEKNCVTCHGEKAIGNRKAMAPPLNVQVDWYLVRQIENFAKGIRTHADAAKIEAADMNDLVAYMSTFTKPVKK